MIFYKWIQATQILSEEPSAGNTEAIKSMKRYQEGETDESRPFYSQIPLKLCSSAQAVGGSHIGLGARYRLTANQKTSQHRSTLSLSIRLTLSITPTSRPNALAANRVTDAVCH